jgi:uncharacterized PurR-regulated membrane protein YhhQ (DUF165 family)
MLNWLNLPFNTSFNAQNNIRWIWAFSYILSIILGNFAVDYFGIVNWFGLIFPAGAIFIGLTFSLRDFTQRYWGNKKVWIFIIISAIITTYMNWKVAAASVVAFLISESTDWFVFMITKKPLHHRIWISNLFSTPLDSILFVTIAFGWNFDAIWGQAIIKYLSGLLVIPFLVYINKKRGQIIS